MSLDDKAQRLEAQLTFARIKELRESPVEGAFDAAHLREINRRIFQDLPAQGFIGVTPGEYRPPVGSQHDWIKHRNMDGLPPTTVAYSPMDEAALDRMDAALSRADPAALARLDPAAFAAEIAAIYTELDYVHPFPDGNSRTLREFTKQLANEAGHDIDWSRFDVSDAGRNVLYVARDLSVNAIALPLVKGENTRRELAIMLDQFGGNRTLPELLPDAVTRISPERLQEQKYTAAEDALAAAVRAHYDSPKGQHRDASLYEIANVLQDLYSDQGHDHAAAPEDALPPQAARSRRRLRYLTHCRRRRPQAPPPGAASQTK